MKAIRLFALMAIVSLMAASCGGGVKYDPEKFGEYFKEVRYKKDLTQDEYATMIDYTKSMWKQFKKDIDLFEKLKENKDSKNSDEQKELAQKIFGNMILFGQYNALLKSANENDRLDSSNKKKYEAIAAEMDDEKERIQKLIM